MSVIRPVMEAVLWKLWVRLHVHCASVGHARRNQHGDPRLFAVELEASGEGSRMLFMQMMFCIEVHSVIAVWFPVLEGGFTKYSSMFIYAASTIHTPQLLPIYYCCYCCYIPHLKVKHYLPLLYTRLCICLKLEDTMSDKGGGWQSELISSYLH